MKPESNKKVDHVFVQKMFISPIISKQEMRKSCMKKTQKYAFKGTVVNLAFPSFQEVSLEITLIVPFNSKIFLFYLNIETVVG